MSELEAVPKVGDKCPFCPGYYLYMCRIEEDFQFLKCQSDKCMYPVAIKKEQCNICQEQTEFKDENALDGFFDDILNCATEEPSNCMRIDSFGTIEPAKAPDDSQSLDGFLDEVMNSNENTFTFDAASPTGSNVIDPSMENPIFHKMNIPLLQEIKQECNNTYLTVKTEELKLRTSMKQLEASKALPTGTNSSSTPKKLKTGQIIRRIIKLEPCGTEEVKEVVQKVTHMKPLDYLSIYFNDQKNKKSK